VDPAPTLRHAWLLALVACGSEIDGRPARWSVIQPSIIRPACATASCHSKHTATGGLQLEGVAESHAILVGGGPEGNYVVPFDPARSKLLYLLRGQDTWRMPPDLPLPEADIELIERWILDGARSD
jgi:hypothetical protein